MRLSTLLILLIIPTSIISQVSVEGGALEIDLVKSKKINTILQVGSVSTGKGNVKIMARVKFKNSTNEEIDLNKFSLVDHKNKLRFRGADILGGILLVDKKIPWGYYKPEIEDTFHNYTLEGYQDFERKTQYTLRKKDIAQTYYHPLDYDAKSVKLIFIVSKKILQEEYDLYYKKTKIATVEL